MTFAEILRQEIERRSWSPRQAARAMREAGTQISHETINTWASGDSLPNMKYGMAIVRTFGIQPAAMLEAAHKQGKAA